MIAPSTPTLFMAATISSPVAESSPCEGLAHGRPGMISVEGMHLNVDDWHGLPPVCSADCPIPRSDCPERPDGDGEHLEGDAANASGEIPCRRPEINEPIVTERHNPRHPRASGDPRGMGPRLRGNDVEPRHSCHLTRLFLGVAYDRVTATLAAPHSRIFHAISRIVHAIRSGGLPHQRQELPHD